jgi:hypothetical protein
MLRDIVVVEYTQHYLVITVNSQCDQVPVQCNETDWVQALCEDNYKNYTIMVMRMNYNETGVGTARKGGGCHSAATAPGNALSM